MYQFELLKSIQIGSLREKKIKDAKECLVVNIEYLIVIEVSRISGGKLILNMGY